MSLRIKVITTYVLNSTTPATNAILGFVKRFMWIAPHALPMLRLQWIRFLLPEECILPTRAPMPNTIIGRLVILPSARIKPPGNRSVLPVPMWYA